MNKRFFYFFILILFPFLQMFGQSNNITYVMIFNKESELFRWYKCSELLYNYSILNKFSGSTVRSILNVLISDEEKINSTLKDYWKNYWRTKSQETQTLAQREFDRNNPFRANQLTFDSKFAQRISDDINERKVANIIIENILDGDLQLQGNPMELSKEVALQGFRNYYSRDYKKFYEKMWRPLDENVPEAYSLPPYLFNAYKIFGPSSDLIHTYAIQTSYYFDMSFNIIPLSFIQGGIEYNDFKTGYGFSMKQSFNFSFSGPLYSKQHISFSHNSFKEILDLKERKDIDGLFYRNIEFWDIVTNFGFFVNPSKSGDKNLTNMYASIGFGGNYRLDEFTKFTLNLYYLVFNHQSIASSFSISNGTWYYFLSPELEFEFSIWNFIINPSVQYFYQFREQQTISNLNIGLGIKFNLGEDRKFGF
jgi:hypothetical protein